MRDTLIKIKHLCTSRVGDLKLAAWIVFIGFIALSEAQAGTSMPSAFTYQGRLMNSAGNVPLAAHVTLYIEVRNSSGTCLLYSEHQNVNTTATGGLFSIRIGEGTRTASVPGYDNDPGYEFSEIFTNKQPFGASASCAGGWTPGNTDSRILKIHVWDGTITTTLADQVLTPVPQASVADTIDGVPLEGLTLNWTNATRPTFPVANVTHGFNRDQNRFEKWNGAMWVPTTPKFASTAIGDPNVDGAVMKWNNTNKEWEPSTIDSLIPQLDGDVEGDIDNNTVVALQNRPMLSVAPNPGEVLKWNGVAWAPATDGGVVSGTADGNILRWNGTTSAWEVATGINVDDNGFVTLPGAPTTNDHAATKDYVDTIAASAGETTISGGTPNHVTKFNATGDNVLNSQIFDNGTGVGIGTTAPTDELTIYNQDKTSSQLSLLSNNAAINSNDIMAGIDFMSNDTDLAAPVVGARIQAKAQINNHGATSTPTALVFSTTPNASTTPVERMRIYPDGSVGIGTTNPQGALDIQSTAPVYYQRAGSNAAHFALRSANGTVVAPTAKMNGETLGQLSFGGHTGSAYYSNDTGILSVATEDWTGANNSGSSLRFKTKSNNTAGLALNRMVIDSTGYVGIGPLVPNEKLTVDGVLSLKESSAPTGTTDYGKLYVKTDNNLYYMNESGVENQIPFGSGVGEVNTGSSLGGTADVFEGKSGVDLRFRGISGGANITVTENANDITLAATGVPASGTTTNNTLRWNGSAWIETDGIQITSGGDVVLKNAPTANDHATTKAYVDTAIGDVAISGGTQNYVTKFNATGDNVVNSQVFDNGTNVGIGTATPMAALHIERMATAVDTALQIDSNAQNIATFEGRNNANSILNSTGIVIKNNAINNNRWTRVGMGLKGVTDTVVLTAKTEDSTNGSGAFVVGVNDAGTIAEKLRVTSAGNVGIGTTNPESKLHVLSDGTSTTLGQLDTNLRLQSNSTNVGAGSEISFRGRSASATDVGTYAAISAPMTASGPAGTRGYLAFSTKFDVTDTGLTERLRITNAGNVGIGTTNPEALLNISSATAPVLQIDPGANTTVDPTIYLKDTTSANGFKIWYDNDDGHTFFDSKGNVDSYAMRFRTRTDGTPVEVMTLRNGSVGIRYGAPTARLHLPAGTATASTAPLKFEPTSATLMSTPENGAMEFDGTDYYLTSGGTRKRIMASTGGVGDYVAKTGDTMTGNLAIQTPSNSYLKVIESASRDGAMIGSDTDYPNALVIRPVDNNVTALPTVTFQSSGNVGIGTVAPSYKLDVNGEGRIDGLRIKYLQHGQTNSFSIGGGNVTGTGATAVGIAASAGSSAVALGETAIANTGIAIGYQSSASGGTGASAIGTRATAAGNASIALGTNSVSSTQALSLGDPNDPNLSVINSYLGSSIISANPQSHTINASGGSGTNIAGANMSIAGGRGTGTGAGGYISFKTAPASGTSGAALNSLQEQMRITPSGNVGIGTTNPTKKLDVIGAGRFEATESNNGNAFRTLTSISDATANITHSVHGGAPLTISLNGLNFSGSPTGFAMNTWNSGAGIQMMEFNRSKNSTIGNHAIVADEDALGMISFAGSDGDQFIAGARIMSLVDGTPANNFIPASIVFSTGAINPTEKMRIKGNGNVGIGTATPALYGGYTTLDIRNATNGGVVQVASGVTGNGTARGFFLSDGSSVQLRSVDSYPLILSTNNTEKMRIDTSGNVGINRTTPQATLDVNGYMRLAKNATQPAACSATNDGALALTSQYTMCVCKGGTSTWVSTADGTTSCSW